MNYIRPTNSDIVRYTLSGDLGSLEISEPSGWNDDEKTFKRSEKVHGVFASFSNNLKFYKGDENNDGGYYFLKNTYDIYGINATVKLVKEEKEGAEWLEAYSGYLNFAEYERDIDYIKIKFDESGLYEKIKARQSEKLELNRDTTMDGDEITPLEKKTVNLQGRRINIIDRWKKKDDEIELPSSEAYYEARAVPMQMSNEVDGNVQSIYAYEVAERTVSYRNGQTGNMFYSIADVPVTFSDINIDLDMNIRSNASIYEIRLDLVIYENGLDYDFKEYQTLSTISNVSGVQHTENWKAVIPTLDLAVGESCALVFHFTYNGVVKFYMEKVDFFLQREEFYEPSDAEFYLPFEAFERIIYVTSNQQNGLKSNLLGRIDLGYSNDGFASLMGIIDGYSIRKYDDKPLTTTFKDFHESFETVAQAGYGIEKINNKEVIRYEHISHFYQNIPTIKIGQPSKITRKVSKDYFYSGIKLGYKNPSGDSLYEEAMGLDEYNTINTYTTNISRIENVFEMVSPYRADDYGKEFARRKRQPEFSSIEEDTRYDDDIWLLDLKKGEGTKYEEKKWEDNFEPNGNDVEKFSKFATGIFSADTASNLIFSPLNLLLRWGFWVRGGLEKYLDTYVRYGSSDGNSELKTQLRTDLYPNSKLYTESDNILVKDLDKGIFLPEEIEFEYSVDSELMRTIQGTSINKDGETIMNYYGLVEFTNEDNMLEYGWLLELKPNGNGKWVLLKANRIETNKSITDPNYVYNLPPFLEGTITRI